MITTRIPPAGVDEQCRNEHGRLVENINDKLMEFQDHAYERGMRAMKEACIAKVNEVAQDWNKAGDGAKASAAVYLAVQLSELRTK